MGSLYCNTIMKEKISSTVYTGDQNPQNNKKEPANRIEEPVKLGVKNINVKHFREYVNYGWIWSPYA